jgi:hypothetical protein
MAKSRTNNGRFTRFQEMAERAPKKRRRSPRRRRRFSSNPGPKSNPPLLTDIFEYALPGFGGFVATKLITNAACAQIAKRWPQYAKHAGALSSLGTFFGSWYLGHRVSFLARYHTPIVVGSAIATAQNLMQIYFPDKLAWIVGSPKQAAIESATQVQQVQQVQQAMIAQQNAAPDLPDHLEEIQDDPSWYTFNDAYDAGRYKGTNAADTSTMPAQQMDPSGEVDLDDEDLANGLFANNGMTSSLEN